MKLLSTILFISTISISCFSQKVAHINTNDLLELMPEKIAAQSLIAKLKLDLENHMKLMIREMELMTSDYQSNKDRFSRAVLELKEQELLDIQQRIEEYGINAQRELELKEMELLEPLINKAKNAINAVAAKEGYDYVIDSSVGSLLVMPSNKNIIDLVQKELGIVLID